MMGRRYILVSVALLVFAISVFGKPVSKPEVEEAVYALLSQWNRPDGVIIRTLDAKYLEDGSIGYYMVDLGEGGWVMVSADDVIRPIIAFSFENRITPESEWSDAARYLLGNYRDEIGYAIKEQDLKRDRRWDLPDLLSLQKSAKDSYIDPLIDVTWNQGGGWNMFCPYDEDGPSDHAYVGCVAVAMAQAMTVYHYPVAPVGIKSYLHEDYGSIAVNYDMADPYRWNDMSSSQADSFNSILLYHCAVSVEMDFGADGSGAFVRTAGSALSQYFGYSKNIVFRERYEVQEEWEALLVDELEAGRPVVYRGGPENGTGHAWNVDGYGDGYFHMNFGWSGSQNGYFSLALINPGTNDFSSDQGALVGIAPPISAPYDIILSELTIEESLPEGSFVADITVEDEDLYNSYSFTCKGKFNFLLRDYEEASFYVEDDKLFTEEVFTYNNSDPEQNSEFLLIIVEDQYGNSYQEEFQISIEKVYNGPVSIAFSDSAVKEHQPVGTVVAVLSIEDEDSANNYTYTLYGPYNPELSDYDPASFYVENDTLKTAVIFNVEDSDTCYLRVELEDSHGFTLNSEFTIQIESDLSGSVNRNTHYLRADPAYPNPADYQIFFTNPEQYRSIEMVEISTGRKVALIEPVTGEIDLSEITQGIYLLIIRTNRDEIVMQKLIIQR